ncbi:MAG TPA: SDR family NAD(P)-dependent oxidoreductase [Burkholderiaceae bacterium]|nr:SDR family NAD(P)-dependent oxidoreductase [Burkholderiaceae bacterium]
MTALHGLHAVVTGASRGIGAAIAQSLAGEGARLTLMGRSRQALETLAGKLPGEGHGVAVCDVAQADSVSRAFDEARGARGPVTILVNNAGQADSAPLGRMSLELWHRMLAVNLTGTFLCTQAAVPDMLSAGWGRIVNIASTAGLKGYPYVSAYVAAKHGVVGLTRSLALELAKKGITVNAVCPGYTETDIVRESIDRIVAKTARTPEAARAELEAGNPQGRLVQPQEVADAVRWLCQPASASLTGQAIAVCGGEVM